jgi:dimethylargininase
MQSFTALVRPPGTGFPQAISNHPEKEEIDLSKALAQHQSYVEALKQAAAKIIVLSPEDSLPDATFIEDTAFIYEDIAYLCSAKEETRRDEMESVTRVLKDHRITVSLKPYVDGGDILNTPEAVYIGLSKRSDEKAARYLAEQIDKKVVPVPVTQGLHLKSAVSYLGNNILLINPERVESDAFDNFQWIEVEEKDSYAANCLALENNILLPAGFPEVREKIERHGFKTVELEMSEFEKADGGVTCLSLILQ